MKSIFKFLTFAILATALVSVSACKKDDDDTEVPSEQEVITTVQLKFTTEDGSDFDTFVFSDEDGPGGDAPIIDDIELGANETYELEIDFIDRSNPADPEFITEEVQDEAEEHLVCFDVASANVTVTAKDQDTNGDPLGLISTVTTGDAGQGTLTISLKHEPTKSASDPCSTGETDVEATFVININ